VEDTFDGATKQRQYFDWAIVAVVGCHYFEEKNRFRVNIHKRL
jgi:uncharacterized protein YkuJ